MSISEKSDEEDNRNSNPKNNSEEPKQIKDQRSGVEHSTEIGSNS